MRLFVARCTTVLALVGGFGSWSSAAFAASDARADSANPPDSTNSPATDAIELSWARSPDADQCISGSELKRAVRKRLGRDPFTEPFSSEVDGFVTRKAGLWSAEIVVRNPRAGRIGNRRLESRAADCRELDEAVVLTVTLIIDPNARQQPESARTAATAPNQPKDPGGTPASPPAPSIDAGKPNDAASSPSAGNANAAANKQVEARASATPATLDAPKPKRTEPANPNADDAELAMPLPPPAPRARDGLIASRLMLAPSLAYNLLPGPTAAVALRGELLLGRSWTAEAAAAYFPERRRQTGDILVGYGLTAVGMASCYQPHRPVTLLACAGGWFGVAHAVVYSGIPDRPGDRFWAGLRTDIGFAATSDRVVVQMRAFGMFPLTRWRFRGPENRPLFEQPWLAPGAEIAVGLRLP